MFKLSTTLYHLLKKSLTFLCCAKAKNNWQIHKNKHLPKTTKAISNYSGGYFSCMKGNLKLVKEALKQGGDIYGFFGEERNNAITVVVTFDHLIYSNAS